MDEDNGRNEYEIVMVKKPEVKENYRDGKGRFVKGKSPGRPFGTKNYLKLIEESLEKQAKLAGVTFWDKLAEWAMTNPISGYALLRKFIPDKQFTEIVGLEPIKFEVEVLNGNTKSTNE